MGLGVLGSGGNPTAFTNASYLQYRWHWDNTGTFAAPPILSAYPDNTHGAITPGDGSVLGGNTVDTSDTSYLKLNAFGRVNSAGAPGAAPSNPPAATDGTAGSVSPTAGANWLANYQSGQGAVQYITAPFTPGALTEDEWSIMMRLFSGPNMGTGSFGSLVLSLVYSFA